MNSSRPPTLKRRICIISQAVPYLASRPIAITSLPVVDSRVLYRMPNHAKGEYSYCGRMFCPARLAILSFSIVHYIASPSISTILLSCQIARVTATDVEAVEAMDGVRAR